MTTPINQPPSSSSPKKGFPGTARPAARFRWRWSYLVGLVLVGLVVIGLWPKPIPVEVAVATSAPLRVTVDDEGQTRVKNRYLINSPAAGHLRRIEHKPGAMVKAGETILAVLETGQADLLDARSLAQAQARANAAGAAREQASAVAARAKAGASLAHNDLERAQQLFERGGLSRQEIDQAAMRATTAAEDSRAAAFALQVAGYEEEQAQVLLRRGQSPGAKDEEPLTIISPVSGRVLRVFQESERLVPAGFSLLEVGDSTDLEVRIEVLSRDGVAIQPGADVWLDQWGGPEPLRARVRWVEPSAFTKISALGVEEQRVYVIADLVDPVEKRPSLGDAYRVEARVVLWESARVLQVPAGALFQRGSEWKLYVIENGRARLKSVTVRHSNGLQTEITSGVSEGVSVIVYPGDRVADNVRVSRLENRN